MIFRYFFVILFISIVSSTFAQTNASNTSTNQNTQEKTVYVTNGGSKYHKSNCRYLSKSSIEKSLETAKSESYTACSRCCGGEASTTKANAVSTGEQCTAKTKAGSRCKRTAAAGSTKCWQH